MKKRNWIIPAVLIVITALAVPLITVFTTSAAYDISVAKNSYFGNFSDEAKIFEESYKYVEIAAKVSPNRENLGTRNDLFCVHREATNIADLEAVCPDFRQKAIKYSGEYVDYLKNNDYRISDYMAYVAKGGDPKLESISYAMYIHLVQLYEYGDKDEAKKKAEDYVHSLPVEALASSENVLCFAKLIQNDSPDNYEWAEKLFNYVISTHNANLDKAKAAFADNKDIIPNLRNFNCANWLYVDETGHIVTDLIEEEMYN